MANTRAPAANTLEQQLDSRGTTEKQSAPIQFAYSSSSCFFSTENKVLLGVAVVLGGAVMYSEYLASLKP